MRDKKNILMVAVVVFVVLAITSCTAGFNDSVNIPNSEEYLAGFFRGIWHGFILVFSFIVSLFNNNVSVYEVHNIGPLYDLGFLLGASVMLGGSGRAGKKSKKK